MEKATSSTVFALPSSNMQYGGKESVRDGFRLALDNYLFKYRNNPSDIKTSLRTTLFKLACYRIGINCTNSDNELILHKCPNSNVTRRIFLFGILMKNNFVQSVEKLFILQIV